MSKLPKAIWWPLAGLVAFAVCYLAWRLWLVRQAEREGILVISCRNHGNQLRGCLMVDADEITGWSLPFLPDVEGAMVFAAYGKRAGVAANCNHGALGSRFGGWQAVSLPPDKWDEIIRRWPEGSAEVGVPLYWCGRSNSKNERFMVTVRSRTNLWISSVSEEQLAERVGRLNRLLTTMGERPVPLNIPDNVDWDKAPPWPAGPSTDTAPSPPAGRN